MAGGTAVLPSNQDVLGDLTVGGSVGVGTTDPQDYLHVEEAVAGWGMRIGKAGTGYVRLSTNQIQAYNGDLTSGAPLNLNVSLPDTINLGPSASVNAAGKITSSGGVDINGPGGTSAVPFNISVAADRDIGLQISTTFGAFALFTDAGVREWAVGTKNGGDFAIIMNRNPSADGTEAVTLDANMNLSVTAGTYLGLLGGGFQTGGALYAVSGAPANGLGNNGDVAFRTDGAAGSGTLVYHKETGSWVALAGGGGSIDGSGAATRVALWSDADTLTSNSVLLWTAASELLVGTATTFDSGVRFQVQGAASEVTSIFRASATAPGDVIRTETSTGVRKVAIGPSALGQINLYGESGDAAYSAAYANSTGTDLAPQLYFTRARGTIASPTDISAGDHLLGLFTHGYRGGYREAAQMTVYAETVAASSVDGQFRWSTSVSGSLTEKMRLVAAGEVWLGTTTAITSGHKLQVAGSASFQNAAGTVVNIYGDGVTSGINLIQYGTGSSAEMNAQKARGTKASPTDISAGDSLYFFDFQGYRTGGFREAALFGVEADAVGSSFVDGRYVWKTRVSGGALTERMRLTATGDLWVGITSALDAGVRLQIQGAASEGSVIIRDNATTPGPAITIQNSSGTTTAVISTSGLSWYESGTARHRVTGDATREYLQFDRELRFGPVSTTLNPRVIFHTDNSVIIGATVAETKLATGGLTIYGAASQKTAVFRMNATTPGNPFEVQANSGAPYAWIDNAGTYWSNPTNTTVASALAAAFDGFVAAGTDTAGSTDHINFRVIAAGSAAPTTVSGLFTTVRSRGTLTSPTIVASGDALGGLAFQGYDGANRITAALIRAFVDGTPGTNDMPGRISFYTTPDGSGGFLEAYRIDSTQTLRNMVAANETGTASAGGIASLPLTVRGFLTIKDSGGTARKVPYYDA